MKLFKIFVLFSILLVVSTSCNKDGDDDGSSSHQGITDPAEVALLLNQNLILPSNAFTLDPSELNTDSSIFVSSASEGRMAINTGTDLTNQIDFTPGAPITAVGMRFGPTGPINFIPVSADDINNGSASFTFSIDPDLCEDIAQICHDIQCYEFALTDDGTTISQADLQDIAMVCGACDEPSCVSLLEEGTCVDNDGDYNSLIVGTWRLIQSINGSDIYNTPVDCDLAIFDFLSNGTFVSIRDSDCDGTIDSDDNGTYTIDGNILSFVLDGDTISLDFEILILNSTTLKFKDTDTNHPGDPIWVYERL